MKATCIYISSNCSTGIIKQKHIAIKNKRSRIITNLHRPPHPGQYCLRQRVRHLRWSDRTLGASYEAKKVLLKFIRNGGKTQAEEAVRTDWIQRFMEDCRPCTENAVAGLHSTNLNAIRAAYGLLVENI